MRDVLAALAAVAAFIALGVVMPDLTPHRLVHAPVGNAALDAEIAAAIDARSLGTVTSETGSVRIVDDHVTVGGLVLERTAEAPELCARRCLATGACSGFAVGKAEKFGAATPLCHIITGPLQLLPNTCCTSGVVRRGR